MIWTDILIIVAALAMFANGMYLLVKCSMQTDKVAELEADKRFLLDLYYRACAELEKEQKANRD
jgi:hypothetical protein